MGHRLLWIGSLGLVLLVTLGWGAGGRLALWPSVATGTAIAPNDWPQLGRDPQRTNASPQAVGGPYRYYWRWHGDAFASRAQPVVANNILYLPTLTGVLYALDAAADSRGGDPPIIWQKSLGSPLRAGAGIDTSDNVVVVGTQHGAIYGLDASSGQTKWVVTTAGTVLGAPLIVNGTAYLGSADGNLYAMQTSNGGVLWKTPVGAPILGSAALSSDGSTVLVTAENVKAYGLNASTGAISWQTQLQGQSAADRWPVVLGNTVVFRTQPYLNFEDLLHTGDCVLDGNYPNNCSSLTPTNPLQSGWAADWTEIKPSIVNYLNANPTAQTLFALNATTGSSLGTVPALYSYGNGDAPDPPTVYNGEFYLRYRPRHGIQQDNGSVHVQTKYDAEPGMLDPVTLDFTDLANTNAYATQFRMTSDEPAVMTVAGNTLLVDSWERLGAIQLSSSPSGALIPIAGVASASLPCSSSYGVGTDPSQFAAFFESCPWLGPTTGEGRARTGAVAAAGRIFWAPLSTGAIGLASLGPANGVTNPPAPTATPAPPAGAMPPANPVSTTTLQGYVWSAPARPIANPPADLQQALTFEIRKILGANQHLLPFYLERGWHGSGSWPPDTNNPPEPANVANSNVFWYDPGELVYTLSIAYPYLDPSTQTQLKTYLQAQMQLYTPLQPLQYGGAWGWETQGQPREYYSVDPSFRASRANAWPPPAPPIQTIYAIWAYANYTGDWTYVQNNWPAIQNLFNAKQGQIDSYAEIAGAIGYARIARQLGDSTQATAGQNAAVAAMQAGYNLTQWKAAADALFPDLNVLQNGKAGMAPGRRGPVFFGLTPEVGQYLHDSNLPAVDYILADLTSPNSPDSCALWYVTRLGVQCELSETSYETPELAWSVFLTEAYVDHQSQAQLRYWLDRPWGLGDLWYLQKLVATIEAAAPTYSATLHVQK